MLARGRGGAGNSEASVVAGWARTETPVDLVGRNVELRLRLVSSVGLGVLTG